MRLEACLVDLQTQLLVVPAADHRPVERAHLSVAFQDDAGHPGKGFSHHHHQVPDPSDAMLPNINNLSADEIAEEDQALHLTSELLEEQGRIVPAEAERGRQRQLDVELASALRNVVKVTLRIRVLQVD